MFKSKERRFKNKINLISSGVILLLGVLLFIFPWFNIEEPNNLLYLLFAIYAAVKLIEYILTRNGTDRENLYTAIACTLASISGFKFHSYSSPMVLSLTLVSWVGIMSVIKLIKLDYYHDRKNGMFYVNLVSFSLFLLLGLLTSINLYFNATVETLMLAFFFVCNGLLSLSENGIRILVTGKDLKIKDFKHYNILL